MLGGYSFSVQGFQKPYLVMAMAFACILLISCFMFNFTKQSLWLVIPGAGLLFPLSTNMLDAITELYGQAQARFTLIVTCVFLFLIGLAIHFLIQLPDALPDEQAAEFYSVLSAASRCFFSLAVGMLVADSVNIKIFSLMRARLSHLHLTVRSLVSSVISQTLLLTATALGFWGGDLFNPEVFFGEMLPIFISAITLTILYTPFTWGVVEVVRVVNKKLFSFKKIQSLQAD